MRRNVSGQFVGCQLIAKADGTPITTGTTTVYVTIDAGTQATGTVGSGLCTHEGHGFWSYAPSQAETNGTHVAFTFENTNAINVTVQIYPIAYDASGQMTGVSLAADQAVNTTKVGGTTQTARDLGASVLLSSGTGTGQILLSSGTVTTGALSAGAITAAAIATGAVDADAIATDAVTEIQAGLATSAALTTLQTSVTTIDDLLDTEMPALTAEVAKIPKSDGTVTWNATALASIETQASDALIAYDPPTQAEMNARTLPTASYATAAAQTTAQTSLDDIPTNAELATSQAAADDATLAAIAALPTSASITALQTSVDDIPTNAEFNARTLPTATYFDPATDTVIVGTNNDKTGYALTAAYDAAKTAASQTSVDDLPTNAELATSQAAADDATLVAIATLQTSVDDLPTGAELTTALDDLPTNAELATALAAADDAVLAAIAALNNLSAAQVNAEVVDALSIDTYNEPTGVPAATATLAAKIGRLHQALTSKVIVTASDKTFGNNAGTGLWKKALSDDGTSYTEGSAGSP